MKSNQLSGTKFIKEIIELAEKAGAAAQAIYDRGSVEVETKDDKSPLTEADKESNRIICEGLEKLGDIPVLSEESASVDAKVRQAWPQYWLVDPLDGTKEFIKRTGDFTINIALIEKGKPIAGVVFAPVVDEMYFAVKGQGAYQKLAGDKLRALKVRHMPDDGALRCLVSRSHLGKEADIIKAKYPKVDLIPMGSSLKFCRIASGDSDFYLRAKPTSEWDTAAAQSVLEEAGGMVLNFSGEPLQYNKNDILNPSFIAIGDPLFDWEALIAEL